MIEEMKDYELSLDEHKTMGDAHIDVIRDMLHARNQGWEE